MSGQVYVFGNNYHAYLGLSNTKLKDKNEKSSGSIMYASKKITFDENGTIVQIASHAALSQDGKVYLWGSNPFCQCHIKHHDVKNTKMFKQGIVDTQHKHP